MALVFILIISNFYGIPYVARAQASGPLDTIIEDTLEPAGKYVSLINSNGIGISEVDNSNGQWQYNAGGLWLSIVAPGSGKIAVFGRDVMIRFVPKKDWNGTTQIKYRSWLASGEYSGNYVNVSAEYTGDTGSYSELEQAAQIVVTPVNDAPYISESSGSTYLDFDGKGYVTIPDLNIYTNSLTIETWVNASSAPTWARIFDTSYGPDNFNLHLTFEGSTGRIALEALPQKGARIKAYMVKTTEQLPLNQWVHVAAVYNAVEKKAYIYWNGILKGSGFMDLTDMANASAQNSNLPRPYNFIGESTWSQDANYVGGMRDYRIWKKAKTQAEIESQMNTSLTGSEANLMVNYKFNNANDGAVAKDSSTGVRNGNIISGKWQSSIGFNSNLVTSVNTPVSKPFKLTDVDAGDVLTLSATSSNTSLLANANITFSGEGTDRNINLTPTANMTGTSTVTVTVNDGTTSSKSSFLLSVVAGKFDLKSITPSVGVMTPAFNRGIIYNKVHVPNKSGNSPNNSIDINVAAVNPADVNVTAYADNGSGVTVSGAYPTFTVSGLAVGVYKPVKIKVADKFSTNFKEYQLDLIRYPGNDADLAAADGLALSNLSGGQPIALSPAYSSNTGSYTATVENNVSSIKVDVIKSSLFAAATLNGANIGSTESANATGNVSLAYGKNVISVVITAEDGKTQKTYTVTIVRKLSGDASLTNLTASPAGLSPIFNTNQSDYTLKVANAVTTAEFTPTAAADAELKVNGIAHPSGTPFSITDLAAGNNKYQIEITAQDGITKKVYSLVILRAPSDVADLSGLSVSSGTLTPAFNNNETGYSVEVPYQVSSLGVTPKLLDAAASLSVDGNAHQDNTAFTKSLSVGLNTVKIVVTSQSGAREKTTLINIIRKASSNADLSNLVLSKGVLNPVYDKNQTGYAVTVANQVSELTITPTPEELQATVSLNGNLIAGAQPRLVNLQVGVNEFNVQVTAEDGVTSKNYVLTIVREASSDADLTNITLSGKPLSGGFDRATSTYYEYIANNITSMTVAATTSDPQATYTINGLQSARGVPLQLVVGENKVTVVVTAADQSTTKEYTVTIVRAASSNANLLELTMKDLSDNAIALTPIQDTLSYTGTVEDEVSVSKLSAVVDDANSSTSVFVNGVWIEDLNAVPLTTGLNVIEVRVTAQDGSMKMYTINLVRNPNTDASLYNLFVSPGELTPEFQQGISDYSVQVDNSVDSMDFWINTNNWEANYTLKKNGASAGVTGSRVTLDEGTNQITVEVTAADASTKKTYTVTVNRAILPKDSSLANLTISSVRGTETLNPEFSSEVFKYFLSVPYEVDQVDLDAVKGDLNARITVNGVTVDQTMPIQLAEGLNIVNLKVTAQDGKTESVYELDFTRESRSSNANLSSIGTDVGVLDPAFDPEVTNYTVEVESDVNSVVLTPVVADAKAGSQITGRDGALPGNLVEGDNIFDIVVTAEDGTVKTYTVNVIKAKPEPTPTPTATPTEEPTATPTPTAEPTVEPTELPTATPTDEPIVTPTVEPTTIPTEEPIVTPTVEPTPATPAPVTPAPATPAPATPAPATPAPATPAPATPAPETPAPATPAPATPAPETPAPTTPAPATPAPATPAAATPAPVTPAPATPAPATPAPETPAAPVVTASTEEITVKVESGQLGQGSVLAETVIQRTQDTGGILHDVVNFTTERVEEVVRKITGSSDNTARIMIPDEKDQVADINVKVPKDAIKTLGDSNVNMEVFTENVRILIPQSSLDNFTEDLYFHVVPIKDQTLRKEVEDRARIERIVREIAADKQIDVVARPMTIETNMQSRPVTLTLPLRDVQLPSGLQERKDFLANLVIFVEHSDGDKELIKATVVDYKTGELGLQFKVNKFSTFTILNMEGWEQYLASAEAAQQQLAGHKAFINGFTDGTFKPDHSITRAEMAAILARNLGYDPSAPLAASSFPDVKDSHWAKGVIEFVKAAGLMQGNDKGQFLPDAPITRGEIAAIASRFKKLDTAAVTSSGFKDADSHWAAKEIAAASKANIINGYGDGTYRPTGNLTRAEAVKIVNRLFGRGPLYGVTTPTWPDVPVTNWAYNEIEEASIDHTFTVRNEGGETLSQ
ncbi:cadherin-like beta sandwich domain-containing protein [Paenibacillus auburnensis]|uniref:cadherin-like beta sandwich domain-containing protein n=1 Tax=Paenibacillus auburnensis TaxID=2905649 RepID=UPI001F275265|nr:cadherin-like beta sandwich domain-containing protein [Paenibacillus auburnensis]